MIGVVFVTGGMPVVLDFGFRLVIRRTEFEIASSYAKSQLVRIKPSCLTLLVFV